MRIRHLVHVSWKSIRTRILILSGSAASEVTMSIRADAMDLVGTESGIPAVEKLNIHTALAGAVTANTLVML